eukprot:639757-Pyramimonas_sp.AAC.1
MLKWVSTEYIHGMHLRACKRVKYSLNAAHEDDAYVLRCSLEHTTPRIVVPLISGGRSEDLEGGLVWSSEDAPPPASTPTTDPRSSRCTRVKGTGADESAYRVRLAESRQSGAERQQRVARQCADRFP